MPYKKPKKKKKGKKWRRISKDCGDSCTYVMGVMDRKENEKGVEEIFEVIMLTIFQINDRHQMTESTSPDSTKQDKYQKVYTCSYHIQTTENQSQEDGGLIYRGSCIRITSDSLFRNHAHKKRM